MDTNIIKKIRYSPVGLALIPSSAIMGIPMHIRDDIYYVPWYVKVKNEYQLSIEMILSTQSRIYFYKYYTVLSWKINDDKVVKDSETCFSNIDEVYESLASSSEFICKHYANAIEISKEIKII